MGTLKLKSSDDVVVTVDVATACYSNTIKTMLEDLGTGDGDEEIPLQNVTGNILAMFVKWAEYHRKNDPPGADAREGEMTTLSDWDKQFLNVDQHVLIALTRAANYLDVKQLLDTACLAMSKLFVGKTPKQIRGMLQLP